jgi:hypothetical protein
MRKWLDEERGYLAAARSSEAVEWHEQEIAESEDLILRFERYDLIARLCVRKALPAGDPAWMAKLICSFIVPPPEEEDTSRHCKDCCPCCREN